MTKRIPRLEFEELDEEVAGALAAKYERLGYLGEFFQCMGHQPRGLKAFIDFTDAAKGALPDKIVDRPHRHTSAAINYYFQGSGLSTVEGEVIEWKAGDLMLSAPG